METLYERAIRQIETTAGRTGHATVYEVATDAGERFEFAMDLTQGAAPILFINDVAEAVDPTPLQSANAGRRPRLAARLVGLHFGFRMDDATPPVVRAVAGPGEEE